MDWEVNHTPESWSPTESPNLKNRCWMGRRWIWYLTDSHDVHGFFSIITDHLQAKHWRALQAERELRKAWKTCQHPLEKEWCRHYNCGPVLDMSICFLLVQQTIKSNLSRPTMSKEHMGCVAATLSAVTLCHFKWDMGTLVAQQLHYCSNDPNYGLRSGDLGSNSTMCVVGIKFSESFWN